MDIYSIGNILIVTIIIIGLGALYFLPTIVASADGHRNAFAIFILNLLLGWMLIGWVIALIWAFTKDKKQAVIMNKNKSVSDELSKLKKLYDEGILTKEEFVRQKKRLLRDS